MLYVVIAICFILVSIENAPYSRNILTPKPAKLNFIVLFNTLRTGDLDSHQPALEANSILQA